MPPTCATCVSRTPLLRSLVPMSVAGLKYMVGDHHGHLLETKPGSYSYRGTAAGFHDWQLRTQAEVLQHREKLRRELKRGNPRQRSQHLWAFVMQKPAEFVISSRSNRDMTAVQLMYAHTRHIYVHRHPKFKACRSLLCSRIHHVVAGILSKTACRHRDFLNSLG